MGITPPGSIVDLPASNALVTVVARRGAFVLEARTVELGAEFVPTTIKIKAEWEKTLVEMERLVHEYDQAEAEIKTLEINAATDFDDVPVGDLREQIELAVLDSGARTRRLRAFQAALRGRYLRKAEQVQAAYTAWANAEMAEHQAALDVLAETAAGKVVELVKMLNEMAAKEYTAFAQLGLRPFPWFPAELVKSLENRLEWYKKEREARGLMDV
jgi:hypothetical protein